MAALPDATTANGSGQPAGSPRSSNTAPAETSFVAAFRAAHDKKDVEAVRKLYCWDGVPADLRQTIRENVTDELAYGLVQAEIQPAADSRETWQEGSTRWRVNLKPVSQLQAVLRAGSARPGQSASMETTYLLGQQNGRYLIVVAVPTQ